LIGVPEGPPRPAYDLAYGAGRNETFDLFYPAEVGKLLGIKPAQ